MGTHNALLRLGDDQYLEVVSIDPNALAPDRPRWFGLDLVDPDSAPRLVTWVARTDDVRAMAEACAEQLGNIVSLSRGPFDWLVTIPADGSMPGDGLTPTLIEWLTMQRPPRLLEDRGCSLVGLEAFHPDVGPLEATLSSLGLEDAMVTKPLTSGERPYMIAHVDTPLGLRSLGGPAI